MKVYNKIEITKCNIVTKKKQLNEDENQKEKQLKYSISK